MSAPNSECKPHTQHAGSGAVHGLTLQEDVTTGQLALTLRSRKMFLITKTALVTCAFYFGISVVLEALLLGFMFWKGGAMYSLNFKAWGLIFGVIWLASFALAWRFTIVPFLAKFPRPLG